jgi:two-component system sensor histidine kinase AlgZ
LPDTCGIGVWLRVLLAVNCGAAVLAFARSPERAALREFIDIAALLEPVTLASLVALCGARRLLERLDFRLGVAAIHGLVLMVTVLAHLALSFLREGVLWRELVWAALATALLLGWLDLRLRAHAPALAEARLMALTARIRPHFLFNALNAVLGVLRSDPRRAERALEELSELFRALMRENRELVPLSEELALARQYLELEKLRLGDRLQVRWDIDACPADALVPPLMLQPLLENAVYHGIEPAEATGELTVKMTGDRHRLVIELSNPVVPGGGHRNGNRMALANIRERLDLFYDVGAHLDIAEQADRYTVRIIIPNRKP